MSWAAYLPVLMSTTFSCRARVTFIHVRLYLSHPRGEVDAWSKWACCITVPEKVGAYTWHKVEGRVC